ncbi:MAG: hypothetical protein WD423_16585 [Rhodothermales bacterium]
MLIKRIILLFWALFFSLVFVTDVADGLTAMGALSPDFIFASANYGFMLEVTGIYGTPAWVVTLLFTGVVVWAGAAAFMFWRAFAGFAAWDGPSGRLVETAFALGIGLWAAFLVADEFFLAYLTTDVSSVHLRLFIAQIASLLVVALVPDRDAG